MADSIEKRIIQDVVNTLSDIIGTFSPLKTVIADPGTFEPSHYTRPVAGIIPLEDSISRRASAVNQHTMELAVRVIVDSDAEHAGWELIEIAADIEEKMLMDIHRGTLAEDTRYDGRRSLYLDRDFPQAGADMMFSIEYKRKTGLPRESV